MFVSNLATTPNIFENFYFKYLKMISVNSFKILIDKLSSRRNKCYIIHNNFTSGRRNKTRIHPELFEHLIIKCKNIQILLRKPRTCIL